MTIDLLWAFLTGLAGSLHCLGMCGPLVIAYSLHLAPDSEQTGRFARPWASSFVYHAAYQVGRIGAYGLLGATGAGLIYFGTLGTSLQSLLIPVTLTGGFLMLLLGFAMLKVVPVGFFSGTSEDRKTSPLNRFMGRHLASPRLAVKAVLGFAAGFLPCMLSWAMVVKASLTANIAGGFLLMLCFGLGTMPVLLFTGFFASLFSLKARLAGERLAGYSVIIMGLIILWKGLLKLA
jgi:uncharacterized protein